MDAIDRFSVAVTGSQVRFSLSAREVGIEPLIDLELGARLGALDASAPQEMILRWQFLRQVFTDFYEVELSLECLNNVPVYLRRFPYRNLGISRAAHLQYHSENWLNEVYILEERFKGFSRRLARAYREQARSSDVKSATDAGIEAVSKGLQELCSTRGDHVHNARYVDRDILILSSSESIAARDPNSPYDPDREFRRIRRLKAAEIAGLNGLVREVVAQATAPLVDLLVVWEPPHAWLKEPIPV
jgi:hypothetical protein